MNKQDQTLVHFMEKQYAVERADMPDAKELLMMSVLPVAGRGDRKKPTHNTKPTNQKPQKKHQSKKKQQQQKGTTEEPSPVLSSGV